MAAFTEEERARIRHHLGYPNVQASGSIQLGIPAMTQSMFLVETAMTNLLESAAGFVRATVGKMDELEERMLGATDRFVADRVGEITLNRTEPDQLEKEYLRWGRRLADDLGAPIYALSARYATDGGKQPINGRRIY